MTRGTMVSPQPLPPPPPSRPSTTPTTRRSRGAALLLLLVYVVLLGARTASACPTEECTCKWKGGKQTVECAPAGLTSLPDGMDPGTQVLNFSGNALQVLRSERFLKMDLINLQKIHLCRNQITRIHDKAFRGLSNLVELDLSDNLLSAVPSETFADYTALMRLSLSGNPIRTLRTNAFKPLSAVNTIEMSNCQIEQIDDGVFLGLEHLEWLRLDGNRIGTIRGQNVLPKSLHGINLHGNRWRCDCNMSDLHAWLINYNVPQQLADPQCVYPAQLKGETIKSLKAEELACIPQITPSALFLELVEGRNVSLHCDVRAIPEATVTWWFQGQVLQNDSLYEQTLQMFYFVEDSGGGGGGGIAGVGERKHSELFLYNTKLEHNGTFACVAENYAGRTQTNYTIRMLQREVPVPEKVLVPYEYWLMLAVAAGASGFIFVLLCCCLVARCVRRSKRRRRASTKDSTVQLQNSKCSSIISDGTTQASGPMLKANGGSTTSMLMGGQTLGGQQEMLYLNPSVAGSNGQQLLQQHQQQHQLQQQHHLQQQQMHQQQLQHQHSDDQYCSPPASNRSYQHPHPHDQQNPDLINDAEANKCRQQMTSTAINDDDMGSEHGGGGGSIQGSHMSCENGYHPVQMSAASATTSASPSPSASSPAAAAAASQKHPATVSAVPRFNPLATLPRGIIKDMYQHQVDVHLNPGYFLAGQDGCYPVEYRMHHQQHPMQPQQMQQPPHPAMMLMRHHHGHHQPNPNAQVNYYRTLPHKPKGSVVAVPRYSMEAETFMQRPNGQQQQPLPPSMGGPPPFDAYTLRDMRYTAQGYPMQAPQHNPKQVAFLDQQQYPSPPDGYKTCDVVGGQAPQPQPQPLMISTGGQQFMHQWPPCLPGYHQQQQQQLSQLVPIQTQMPNKPLLHQASLQSPTSSTSSSTTTQTSQTSSSASTNTTTATGVGGGVSKRCVGAQTLDPKDTIHEQNEEDNEDDDDEDEEVNAGGEVENGESAGGGGSGVTLRKAGKLKLLNGPLADSPDEGYVGDSQDGSDM